MALSVNEIQIGDWVMYNGNIFIDDEYEPSVPIEPIQIDSGEDIDLAIEGCYTPIPLTIEILERNGFIEDDDNDLFIYDNGNNYFVIGFCREIRTDEIVEESFMSFGRCKCVYIHELQHALRLCGLNGLADNFKVE